MDTERRDRQNRQTLADLFLWYESLAAKRSPRHGQAHAPYLQHDGAEV
jgi:hypothetical protein